MKDRRRTQIDNTYRYYTGAARKAASEHDDRRQLESGLNLARDIYIEETWRVFCEEILPSENRKVSTPRQSPQLTSQQQAQRQKGTAEISAVKKEAHVSPVAAVRVAKQPVDSPKVVSFLDYKKIYARRKREQQQPWVARAMKAVSR